MWCVENERPARSRKQATARSRRIKQIEGSAVLFVYRRRKGFRAAGSGARSVRGHGLDWDAVDLTDKVALITGGRRIGAVVATELARRGAHVAVVYRASRTEAEETARAVGALTRRALVLQADLQQPAACEQSMSTHRSSARSS